MKTSFLRASIFYVSHQAGWLARGWKQPSHLLSARHRFQHGPCPIPAGMTRCEAEGGSLDQQLVHCTSQACWLASQLERAVGSRWPPQSSLWLVREGHLEEIKLVHRLERKVLLINNSNPHILPCTMPRERLRKTLRPWWEDIKHHCSQDTMEGADFRSEESTGLHQPHYHSEWPGKPMECRKLSLPSGLLAAQCVYCMGDPPSAVLDPCLSPGALTALTPPS